MSSAQDIKSHNQLNSNEPHMETNRSQYLNKLTSWPRIHVQGYEAFLNEMFSVIQYTRLMFTIEIRACPFQLCVKDEHKYFLTVC